MDIHDGFVFLSCLRNQSIVLVVLRRREISESAAELGEGDVSIMVGVKESLEGFGGAAVDEITGAEVRVELLVGEDLGAGDTPEDDAAVELGGVVDAAGAEDIACGFNG